MAQIWHLALATLALASCGRGESQTPSTPMPTVNMVKPASASFADIPRETPVCAVAEFRGSLSPDLRDLSVREVTRDQIGQCSLIVHFNENLQIGWAYGSSATFNSEKCIIDVVRQSDGASRAIAYAIRSKPNSADNCLLRLLVARAGKPEILTAKDADLASGGLTAEQALRAILPQPAGSAE